jgi:hypothetical protein
MRLIDWHENMFHFLTPLFIFWHENEFRVYTGCKTQGNSIAVGSQAQELDHHGLAQGRPLLNVSYILYFNYFSIFILGVFSDETYIELDSSKVHFVRRGRTEKIRTVIEYHVMDMQESF